MTAMRPVLIPAAILAVLSAATPVRSQSSDGSRAVERRFPIDSDAYVKVYLLEGEVRVTGWEKDSIAVTGTVDGGRLFSGGRGKSAKLGLWEEPGLGRLEVRVPASATVWVKSESAAVSVAGVAGGIDVYSVTGGIRIEGSPRQIYAESMGGNIVVEASAPSIRAKTAGGTISFRGRTDDLLLSTVSGSIDAAPEGPPLRGRLETVTGRILWQGGVERGGSLDFQTHSGTVDLSFPTGLDAEVSVSTVEGSISGKPGPAEASEASLRGPTVDILVGAGGARIGIRTFSGDVIFR
ncbi:MAG: DUF4097 family beta strand repeat-containing protein [Gemmatimonadota bacterium]